MSKLGSQMVIRNDEGKLASSFVRNCAKAISLNDEGQVRTLIKDLHEADFADLLELLSLDNRQSLVAMLGKDLNYAVLSELDEAVRDDVLEVMPTETVAEAVRELDSEDAVYLLEDLNEIEQDEILEKIPAPERTALKRSLEYPDDSAGRLMQSTFVAVPSFWTVGQTIDHMRYTGDLPDNFFEIFVVDPGFHLKGTVPLSRVLRNPRKKTIENIMDVEQTLIPADMDQEMVAYQFKQYNLISAAVVDKDERLVGVITVDDIVEVIHEEAHEDILRLGGVGDESLADTVLETARGRFSWLLINLATAVLASFVISLFDATIEQMVALAVLMPIVASMGGNAGTQTMTVAVRAIASRDLIATNATRIITRETLVGLLNGVLFAVIVGVVTVAWFGQATLGLVIACAMVVNMLVAAIFGILIPLLLDRLDIDPAVASGVFVTTVTDVVGFFSFLGLAALWLV
jgi:magnesium transporter